MCMRRKEKSRIRVPIWFFFLSLLLWKWNWWVCLGLTVLTFQKRKRQRYSGESPPPPHIPLPVFFFSLPVVILLHPNPWSLFPHRIWRVFFFLPSSVVPHRYTKEKQLHQRGHVSNGQGDWEHTHTNKQGLVRKIDDEKIMSCALRTVSLRPPIMR